THEVRPEVVTKMAQVKELALAAAADANKEANAAVSGVKCRWTQIAPHGDHLVCDNVTLNRFSKACGYHTQRCQMKHPGESVKLHEANELGLCRSHYTVIKGRPPDATRADWNYIGGLLVPPGVRSLRQEKQELRVHSLRPDEDRLEHSEWEGIAERAQSRRNAKFQLLPERERKRIRAPNPLLQMAKRFQPLRASRDFAARVKDDFDEFTRKHKTMQLAVAHMHEQRKALRRVLFGHEFATRIQRAFRGFSHRNRAASLRRAVVTQIRWAAAITIQKTVRRVQARAHVIKFRSAQRKATALLQRVARGHITRREMRRMRAARTIQRVYRGFATRLITVARKVVAEFRAMKADAVWANLLIVRYLKRYIARWRAYKVREHEKYVHACATQIQRAARAKIYRNRIRDIKIEIRRTNRAASIIQYRVKSFLCFRRSLVKEVIDESGIVLIQAAWRGFRVRIQANMEREAVEKAWRWLGDARPRTSYERYLPRTNYGNPVLTNGATRFWMDRDAVRMQDLLAGIRRGPPPSLRRRLKQSRRSSVTSSSSSSSSSSSLTSSSPSPSSCLSSNQEEKESDGVDAKKEAFRKEEEEEDPRSRTPDTSPSSSPRSESGEGQQAHLWSKLPFVEFDPGKTGRIRRYEFAKGLRQMMYQMPDSQIDLVVKRWARNDGSVNYVNFLRYVRQETSACEKHRAWACPTCVSYGPCLKCDCRRYKAGAHGGSGRAVCSCGHYVAMHSMIPRIHTGRTPGSESEALSKAELKRMLAPPAPAELPRTVQGTRLAPSQFRMHFAQHDLGVRAQTAAAGSSRLRGAARSMKSALRAQTPIEVLPAVNMSKRRATTAFQRLGERIIGDIAKESEQIVRELKQDGAWNNSVNPRDSFPGTARPQTSHRVPGVGEIERLEARPRPGTSADAASSAGAANDRFDGPRPSTTRLSSRRRRGSRRVAAAMAQNPLPTPVLDPKAAAYQEDQAKLEKAAIRAETCGPEALGSLLLQSAARPHTAAHVVRPWTREGRAMPDHLQNGVSPAYVKRVVRAESRRRELREELAKDELWSCPDDFARGFHVADPVPLIVNDNLRMETKTAPLYVDMLLALSSRSCGLLEDWPAFVAYVFQSFAFIDRHWRKLVYDIRTGTLNKLLPVSARMRAQVESQLEADPARAEMLDAALEQLGFYKSNSGPSGVPSGVPSSIAGVAGAAGAAGAAGKRRRAVTAGGVEGEAAGTRKRRASVTLPLTVTPDRSTPESLLRSGNVDAFKAKIESDPHTQSLELDTLPEKERKALVEAIAVKDVYDLKRAPRMRPSLVHKHNERDIRKYSCTFPGCGQAFMTDRDAEAHVQQEHVGKFRLANGEHAVDHRLHAYWPRVAPWIPKSSKGVLQARAAAGIKALNDAGEEKRLADQEVRAYYPFCCSRQGCSERFHTKKELHAHEQTVHARPEQLKALVGEVPARSWIDLQGSLFHVPPSALPAGIRLPCCSKHWAMAQPRCEECVEVIARGVPVSPLHFFNSAVLHGELPLSGHTKTVVHVWNPRRGREHLGRVVALFSDRFERRFLAYRRFLLVGARDDASSSVTGRGRGSSEAGAEEAQEVAIEHDRTHVVELHHVRGTSIVLETTRRDFVKMKIDQELPQLPVLSQFPASRCEIEPGVFFTPPPDPEGDEERENVDAPLPGGGGGGGEIGGVASSGFEPLVKRIRDVVVDRSGLFDRSKADF
ncbi:Abnormal spindle-like microcephaly-associated protein-like, partial [Hondaea fermentalgiana]